jgi:hypothetical protein
MYDNYVFQMWNCWMWIPCCREISRLHAVLNKISDDLNKIFKNQSQPLIMIRWTKTITVWRSNCSISISEIVNVKQFYKQPIAIYQHNKFFNELLLLFKNCSTWCSKLKKSYDWISCQYMIYPLNSNLN